MKENWKHCRELTVILVGSAEAGHKFLGDQITTAFGTVRSFPVRSCIYIKNTALGEDFIGIQNYKDNIIILQAILVFVPID